MRVNKPGSSFLRASFGCIDAAEKNRHATMKYFLTLLLAVSRNAVLGNFINVPESALEDRRIDMIVDIISLHLKNNGWNTILCYGHFPDSFYTKIQHISYAFVVMNLNEHGDNNIEDVVHYQSNMIIISCLDFKEYEESILELRNSPYWHPLANIIVYYHQMEKPEVMAKIFFSSWYYKAINTIIVQYNDGQGFLFLSDYSPYVSETYKLPLQNQFGCWTAKKIGMPVIGFEEGLICVEKCHNVTLYTKLRANNLGTCIGFNTYAIAYNAIKDLKSFNLFQDKSKNFHGFMFRAHASEVEPFLTITEHENGTYTLHSRDGIIWNTMTKLMNFGIDLTPSVNVMKKPFNFELSIEQLFAFARRKVDIFLVPIYIFDTVIVEVDFTFPYKESGVCIMSSRAGFETTIFDVKTLEAHYEFIVQFIACFICIWFTFSIYKGVENGRLTFDQIGKDLMNSFRNVLLINLYKPPKREYFRIFLAISLWSFFLINFTSQATIISFFTAAKRGKEVETFEDMIEKGYDIEGLASPDLILPDTEERFRIINSRLVPEQDILGCIHRMSNDSRRFCLIDCSVGRYIERNKLNEKGEQYLHTAQDRMHSHYLSIIQTRDSPLTDRFHKYMIIFFEAGLIKKWEQYRYTDIKDEASTKPLGMEDLNGIFELYCFSVGFTIIIFLLELVIYYGKKMVTIIKIMVDNVKYRFSHEST